MADERFRVAAEVTDGFTGPLAKMQTALRGVHTTGSQSAGALKKDFESAHGAIGKATGALQQMTPVLTTLGISTAGAALGISGVASAIKGFTSNTQALSMMSKETGISIDKLRALGALGEQFGVSASTMQGSVRGIAKNMFELRRRWGEAYSGLQKMNLGDLAEQLVSAPNMEVAIKRIMEKLGSIKDPEIRRRVASLLGAEDLASVAGEVGNKYEQTMADIARRLGRTTQQQVDSARRFEGSIAELRQNLDGLRTEALAPTIEKLNEFVKALQSPEAMEFFKKELAAITSGIGNTYREFEALVNLFNKLKSYLPGGDGKDERSWGIQLNDMLRRDLGLGPRKDEGPVSAKELQRRLTEKQNELSFYDDVPAGGGRGTRQEELRREINRLTEELRKVREQGGNPTASPSSFSGGGFGGAGLIHNAALSGGGGALGGRRFGEAGSGAPGWGFPGTPSGRPLQPGDPGYGGAPVLSPALPRSSIPAISGGGALSPRGSGSLFDQSPSSTGAGAANPEAFMRLGNAISRAEGTTRRGYDEVLGAGIYGLPPKPISTMTLDEAFAFGRQIRARHGSSSALGKFQIVGNTMRAAQKALGLPGDTLFDGDTQDRMMRWIARRQGLGAWEGFRGHPEQLAIARDAIAAGGHQDGPGTGMSRLRDTDIEAPGSGERPGDAMMRRMFAAQPATPTQHHTMSIDVTGQPFGAKMPKVTMSDMFKDVAVSKSRQMDAQGI